MALSLVIREKRVEEMMILEVFIPLICLVKYFWPRYRVAKDIDPVASLQLNHWYIITQNCHILISCMGSV